MPVTENRQAWQGVFDAGVISSSTKSSAIGAWIFAIVWNAITVPAVVLGFNNARQHWDQRVMVLLIFPLCGLLMLVNAIVQTRRAFKFGRSTLTLAPLPAHPAETLRAIIDTSSALPADAECVADLQCIRQTRRPYNNRSGPIDEIVWQDDHPVSIVSKGIASRIETEFDLPPDAQVTQTIDLRARIYWRLIVHAQVPGIDYRETFELPVFSRQPGDAPPIVRATPARDVSPAISLASELGTQRIWLQQFAGGSLQIELPPARHLGNILIIALFAVIFDAATVFLAFSDWFAKFMSIPFGLVALLMTFFAMSLLFVRTTITADRDGLTITRSALGLSRTKQVKVRDIDSLNAEQTMSSGNTVYYSLKVKTAEWAGDVGSGIQGREIADRLAAAVKSAMQIG